MSRVPTFDLLAQLEEVRDDVLAAVERVLASGRVVQGPEVERFEREFAATLGEGVHGVGVSSGTAALAVALRALGAGPGDEVVTVANTAVATVSAIREAGATPVFCDVSPDTALMDLARLPPLLTPRTKVVLPVHLYGNAVDVEALRALLPEDVRVLEDCAQAHGGSLRGRPLGALGDAAAFSFYPTKNLGAYGDAGLCATADAALAASMRSLRSYGTEDGPESRREGWNARLDEVQAAILCAKLPHLARWVERRRQLAARYDASLPDAAGRLVCAPGALHARHLEVVRVGDRERVRAALDARGIDTAVHYPVPIHRMRAFARFAPERGLPASERLAAEVLTLPLYPELPEEAVDRVCAALREALA